MATDPVWDVATVPVTDDLPRVVHVAVESPPVGPETSEVAEVPSGMIQYDVPAIM
jgi:hypothetical protein